MKRPYLLFGAGIFFTVLGLAADSVSASSYGFLFLMVFLCDFISAGCFVSLFRMRGRWPLLIGMPSIAVIYTATDAAMRLLYGTRVFDFLH